MLDILQQTCEILAKYGDAPELYEPREAAYTKILNCIKIMDSRCSSYENELSNLRSFLAKEGFFRRAEKVDGILGDR